MAASIKKTFLQLDKATGIFKRKQIQEVVVKEKQKGIGSGNSHKRMATILIEKLNGNLSQGSIINAH